MPPQFIHPSETNKLDIIIPQFKQRIASTSIFFVSSMESDRDSFAISVNGNPFGVLPDNNSNLMIGMTSLIFMFTLFLNKPANPMGKSRCMIKLMCIIITWVKQKTKKLKK